MKTLLSAAILLGLLLPASAQNKAADKKMLRLAETSFQDASTALVDPSKIDIVRDRYGVPHIFAKTDAEVAFGLAWAHAEDDFKTIQKAVLASRSMLGQYAGKDGATVDFVVHLLRIRELVESRYQMDISPAFKALLEGYCAGLNAYADAHPKEVLVKKSFPAIPEDLIAYSVLQLAVGCGLEAAFKQIDNGSLPMVEWEPTGSNAIALNSSKTTDGAVYLTINTHHPLEGQVAWYEAHLSSEEGWNIIGGLFPASPIVLTGFNEDLGWTHTVNHPDRLDIYQLQTHPQDPLQYRYDEKWLTLDERTVKLKVKVSAINVLVKKKVYWSVYGPTVVTEKGVFALRISALFDIRGLEQWYRMNKAQNFTQFRKALEMESHPGYNIVYGDRYDTIYYLSNGRLPQRTAGYDWKGILPGNTSMTLWSKFHRLENLPQVLNPTSGYVFNVNHSPFTASHPSDNLQAKDYDSLMGYETHENNRSIRLRELIRQHPKVNYEDFKRMKYDLQLPKQLAYPVNMDTLFLLDESRYPEIADLIVKLRNWDRRATIDSEGAAVFAVVFYYVANLYLNDTRFTVMTREKCAEALYHTKKYLLDNFNTLHVKLGDYQRLERGNESLPLAGIPDVLATMYSTPTAHGRMKGTIGDCYIAFARYTASGPEIETVNAYGASNRPESPHYDDQMKLYQQHKTKTMTLDRDKVYADAYEIYHPEELSRVRVSEKLLRARK